MNKCLHCGLKTQEVYSNSEKASDTDSGDYFCCNGCKIAYNIINNFGLKSYYRTRELKSGEKILKPDENVQNVDMSAFSHKDKEGNFNLNLIVSGIHCASCIWLIESILNKQDGVLFARVNMTTRRLVIKWNGDIKNGDEFVGLINSLGYKLMPYDPEIIKEIDKKEEKRLLLSMAVAGFAAGNVMLVSVSIWSSDKIIMGMATRDFFHWFSALIAVPAIIFAGRPFFYSALSVLKSKNTNMDVPISVGVIIATIMSLYETVNHGEHIYFDSAIMLLFFLLIGRYLDIKAKGKARSTAHDLLYLMSGSVKINDNSIHRVIPLKDVKEGMEVIISAGEKIPVDGVVINGKSEIDTSLITGETIPREICEGDEIFTGNINISSPLTVRVKAHGENSLLAEIVKLMENAEQGRAKYVFLADKIAGYYTPVVHILGVAAFLMWWLLLGLDWQPSLMIAVTVLIITCPCALGLAVPVVQIVASGNLMKKGILLKSANALEKIEQVNHIIFDKTGTLTLGKPKLINIDNISEGDLRLAASLASKSKHPLSQAIMDIYNGKVDEYDDIIEFSGKGLQSSNCKLGKRNWVFEGEENINDSIEESNKNEYMEIWLKNSSNEYAQFIFQDDLRADSNEVIGSLQKQNYALTILSGDRENIVKNTAKKLNIDDYKYEMSPKDKYKYVERLKSEGKVVLFIGDGLNDAPSLAAANVSISPSTAMDISQNTADIVFQGEGLKSVEDIIFVAKSSLNLVKQNFMIACVYNLIAIPIAFSGFVTPMIAAIAMSGSSLVVIVNSLRLTR